LITSAKHDPLHLKNKHTTGGFCPVDTNQLVGVKENATVHFLVIIEFPLWVVNRRRNIEFERQFSRKRTPKWLGQEAISGQQETLSKHKKPRTVAGLNH